MGNSIGLCSLRLPHPPSSYRIPPTNHRLRASRPTHALECAHIAMAPKWSTQGPTRIAHCLLSTKICQIYHLHLRIQNGLYSPTNGGATIFSNTHIWVWKSDTPKSPLVYHHLLPKKKTLWSKSPPFFSHNQRFFCACTQKDLNPVLRLRPRPKHQLGGVEGIDQHHLTAQVFNGFWMFWALKLEGSSLKYGGTKNGVP